MKRILFFFLFPCATAMAQPTVYTTANAHSHNDYQQPTPFEEAYNLQYGSIETDVYLSIASNELLVARNAKDAEQHRTLEELYLKPLAAAIDANKGNIYADPARKLIFMLDVKTEATPSLNKLIDLLIKYPSITRCNSVTIMVTGSKPDPTTYISYPSYIWFDGLVGTSYNKETLSHIAVMGDNFINYTRWNGHGDMPAKELELLKKAVAKAHAHGKRIRFWNVPDFDEGWKKSIELGVDFINTDSIKALAEYLKTNGARQQ